MQRLVNGLPTQPSAGLAGEGHKDIPEDLGNGIDWMSLMMVLGFAFTFVLGVAALAIYLLKDMFGPRAADVEDPAPRIVRPFRVLIGACVAFLTSFFLSSVWSVDSYLANVFIQGSAFLAAAYLASRIAQERAFPAVAIGLSFWLLLAAYLLPNAEEHLLRSIVTVTGYVSLALLAAWWFGRSYARGSEFQRPT